MFPTLACRVIQSANTRTAVMLSRRPPKKCFLCRLEEATRREQSQVLFENGSGNRKIKFTECRQRDGNKNTFNSIGWECLLRPPLLGEMSASGSKILRGAAKRTPRNRTLGCPPLLWLWPNAVPHELQAKQ